ncbi:MAG: MarR family transcriptional regulator [Anaerolineaceae bacterium]
MQSNPKEPVGKILADLCRTRATLADKLVDNYGIYHGQAILLMTLSNQDGITHSDLAENLKISPAAISKVIKRLERANYIKRESDPNDERISRVYLLQDGYSVVSEIKQAFAQLDQIMFQGFDEEDQETFRNLIVRAQTNLSDYSESKS